MIDGARCKELPVASPRRRSGRVRVWRAQIVRILTLVPTLTRFSVKLDFQTRWTLQSLSLFEQNIFGEHYYYVFQFLTPKFLLYSVKKLLPVNFSNPTFKCSPMTLVLKRKFLVKSRKKSIDTLFLIPIYFIYTFFINHIVKFYLYLYHISLPLYCTYVK